MITTRGVRGAMLTMTAAIGLATAALAWLPSATPAQASEYHCPGSPVHALGWYGGHTSQGATVSLLNVYRISGGYCVGGVLPADHHCSDTWVPADQGVAQLTFAAPLDAHFGFSAPLEPILNASAGEISGHFHGRSGSAIATLNAISGYAPAPDGSGDQVPMSCPAQTIKVTLTLRGGRGVNCPRGPRPLVHRRRRGGRC